MGTTKKSPNANPGDAIRERQSALPLTGKIHMIVRLPGFGRTRWHKTMLSASIRAQATPMQDSRPLGNAN
jgi:hypothetical protein